MTWPRLVFKRQPDPVAGAELEFEAQLACWKWLAPLSAHAQLRIVEHLREVIDERARYEMREITNG